MQEALGVFCTAAVPDSSQDPAKDPQCQTTASIIVCSMNKPDRPLGYSRLVCKLATPNIYTSEWMDGMDGWMGW